MNTQFLTRNQNELAQVITSFRELCLITDGTFVLYLDKDIWEIFDTRRALVIIRHNFKQVSQLIKDIRQFRFDLINVGSAAFRNTGRFDLREVNAIKHIYKLYGFDEYYFKTEQLKKYVYERFKKTTDLENCMVCD